MSRRVALADTPENRRLVLKITGEPEISGPRARRLIVLDGVLHRANGRYIVGNVCTIDDEGRIAMRARVDEAGRVLGQEVITRRHRFRIPKGHPWRGKRP